MMNTFLKDSDELIAESYLLSEMPLVPPALRPPLRAMAQAKMTSTVSTLAPAALSTSDATWVKNLADRFIEVQNQDEVHNAILLKLLGEKYSASAIPANDPKAAAYNVLRSPKNDGSNLGRPLYSIRSAGDFTKIYRLLKPVDAQAKARYPKLNLTTIRQAPNFFIRDFMQVYSQGGLTIENLLIEDTVLNSPFATDFNIWVREVNTLLKARGKTAMVYEFKSLAHRDAIQLIPVRQNDIDVLNGVMLRKVIVQNNIVSSAGALQGIFASDGAFKELRILNNHIAISGAHTISINGLLSGQISGNTDLNGVPLTGNSVKLLPLRLGGGANVYVLGFKNKPGLPTDGLAYYQYETIIGVNPQYDLRRTKQGVTNPTASFYTDVDMMELHRLVRRELQLKRVVNIVNLMRELVQAGFARVA